MGQIADRFREGKRNAVLVLFSTAGRGAIHVTLTDDLVGAGPQGGRPGQPDRRAERRQGRRPARTSPRPAPATRRSLPRRARRRPALVAAWLAGRRRRDAAPDWLDRHTAGGAAGAARPGARARSGRAQPSAPIAGGAGRRGRARRSIGVVAHPGDRSVALDLLAADALITLALLAQAQAAPASAGRLRRLASLQAVAARHVIDLHSHLLPGVDDGSRTVEQSVGVLRRMARAGHHRRLPHAPPPRQRDGRRAARDARRGVRGAPRGGARRCRGCIAAPRSCSTARCRSSGDRIAAHHARRHPLHPGRVSPAGRRRRRDQRAHPRARAGPRRRCWRIPSATAAAPSRRWRAGGASARACRSTPRRCCSPQARGAAGPRSCVAAGLADILAGDNHGDERTIAARRRLPRARRTATSRPSCSRCRIPARSCATSRWPTCRRSRSAAPGCSGSANCSAATQ